MLTKSFTAVSSPLHPSLGDPQVKCLAFDYGWVEGEMRTHNISGSSGFFWLMSLRPYQWSTFYFDGNIPPLLESQITTECGSQLVRQPPHHIVCIGLVACTVNESLKILEVHHPRVVLLTTRPRQEPAGKLQFLTIKHCDVGGVTTYASQFLLFKCPTVVLPKTVQGSIASVIEHKRLLPSFDNTDNYITSDDLPIRGIDNPIRLPLRWSTDSGYTTRRLASTELCSAFDLPKWCLPANRQVSGSFFSNLVPIKAQLSITDFILPTIGPPGTRIGARRLEQL